MSSFLVFVQIQEDHEILTGFVDETVELLDSFWNVQTNLSGTYGLLEELWELMEFQEENGILTSRTEGFLKFCMNQTVEGNTSQTEPRTNMSNSQSKWLQVDDVSECAAAFTEFKNHFRHMMSYPYVELPDEFNIHRTFGLLNEADDDHDNDCSCIHNYSISIHCHIEYFTENRDKYREYRSDERNCLQAVDYAYSVQDCYKDTLGLSSNLIQAESFAEALCYVQEIRKVIEHCLNPLAKDLDTTLRRVCLWTRQIRKEATRSKSHLLKVEDSARRAEPLLLRWHAHHMYIYYFFTVKVVNFYFQILPSRFRSFFTTYTLQI